MKKDTWEVAVIGGGPAGAQCALWLTKLGVSCILIEANRLGGLQAKSPYRNAWLSVVQATTMAKDIAANIQQNLYAQGVHILKGKVHDVSKQKDFFLLKLEEQTLKASSVVLATGTVERSEKADGSNKYVIGLVGVASFNAKNKRVAVLGGGDSACEAYESVKDTAEDVRIFARTIRANNAMWSAIPNDAKQVGKYSLSNNAVILCGQEYHFDSAVVCYGWQPNVPSMDFEITKSLTGHIIVDQNMQTSVEKFFAIGDVNQRPYPCVSTAISDGVHAAKTIEAMLK